MLGTVGGKDNFAILVTLLSDDAEVVRLAAVERAAKILGRKNRGDLLSLDVDLARPWLDPKKPIDRDQLHRVCRRFVISEAAARSLYSKLNTELAGQLKLSWDRRKRRPNPGGKETSKKEAGSTQPDRPQGSSGDSGNSKNTSSGGEKEV